MRRLTRIIGREVAAGFLAAGVIFSSAAQLSTAIGVDVGRENLGPEDRVIGGSYTQWVDRFRPYIAVTSEKRPGGTTTTELIVKIPFPAFTNEDV